MPGKIPDKIWLFRIMHWQNVEYIVEHGMYRRGHAQFDPDYVNIGDRGLILDREEYPVKVDGYGTLGEYVPFYFGPLSPMLLNIKTGHRGIELRPQRDIVYILCSLDGIEAAGCEYIFSDGHAKVEISRHFNDKDDLDKVDWSIVSERYWSPTEEDMDRQRRKQAEFMVREHVPVSCIEKIVVYDQERYNNVKNFVDTFGRDVEVIIDKKRQLYYP